MKIGDLVEIDSMKLGIIITVLTNGEFYFLPLCPLTYTVDVFRGQAEIQILEVNDFRSNGHERRIMNGIEYKVHLLRKVK